MLGFTRLFDHGKCAGLSGLDRVILQEAFVMKNLLALVGAAVVVVVGLGWYLRWFKVGSEPATPGRAKFNVEVKTDKVESDEKKFKQAVGEFIEANENGNGTPGQPTSLPLPGSTSFVPPPTQLPQLPPPPSVPVIDPSNIVIPPPPSPPGG